MKRLMIIAGGTWQVPLIKKAKALGYEVVNTNLYENSPGFCFSDFTAVSDVRDKVLNLSIAEKYKVSGVVTDQTDIAVSTVAYVAQEIGCPGIGLETAEIFTNKHKMRSFCSAKRFDSPEYRLCNNLNEAIHFFDEKNMKMILKPVDSQSSRGIFTINSVEDLEKNFEESQSFSSDGRGVLLEQYISGTEFTIDGVMYKGKHYSLAISEKKHFAYNKNIASDLLFSHQNENYDYDALRAIHDKLIDSTDLKFGLTHAEYKYENGKFYLIEMAARGGGTKIASDIVPFMSGIDTYAMLIHSALGEDFELPQIEIKECCKNQCAILKFLDIESAGKEISAIEGVELIQSMDGILDFGLEFSVGDIVEQAQDDRSRVGYYIACANSMKELKQIMSAVDEHLKIKFA